jgi:erythronate-4-phosphate dehydrogenase
MNIIIDENIPQAREAFSTLGNVKLLDGRILKNDNVKDTDVLIVRSITKVNKELLKNSRVKFVGTATIGTDHVDLEYLKEQNIQFADAKGCNADSVAEYVFTSLLKVALEKNISLKGKSIGVVGVGNIGSRIVRLAESLGMNVLKNDPPLERKGVGNNYTTLDDTIKADIVTFHVPMTYEGIDKTFHLLNEDNLKMIKNNAILINSSRGAVVDNEALLTASRNRNFHIVLDVWENEPSINIELLSKTKVATPHIAGYSYEGKVNGTRMIYNALCKFLNKQSAWQPELPEIGNNKIKLSREKTEEENLYNLFSSIYKIDNDDKLMRMIQQYELNERAKYFDMLRKKYPIRREFSNYIVQISKNQIHLKSFLENFRFKVEVN